MIIKKEKTCCFTGHRDLTDSERISLAEKTREVIKQMIQEGVVNFISGGSLGFDTVAAIGFIAIKEEFPDIKLILCLPCKDQQKYWSDSDKAVYKSLIESADEVMYAMETYSRGCMQMRNRLMVDASAYCVYFLTKESGGTAYTVKYALNQGVKTVDILSI